MILFHGTVESNLKKIKRDGLQQSTSDQWIYEVLQSNVCCLSKEPTSGEGGSPIYFAGRHDRAKNQSGYLVIISMDQATFEDKLLTIWDNKTLDEYALRHFFLREEFRHQGYNIFQRLQKWKKQNRQLKNFDTIFSTEPRQPIHDSIFASADQQTYYRSWERSKKIYLAENLTISDNLFFWLKSFGSWNRCDEFLSYHFGHISQEQYHTFYKEHRRASNSDYWKSFYQKFATKLEKRRAHFQDWFSPDWLASRKKTELEDNCQILTRNIEPKYIVDFLQVTDGSGVISQFRPVKKSGSKRQPKYTLNTRIWRAVNRMLNKKAIPSRTRY